MGQGAPGSFPFGRGRPELGGGTGKKRWCGGLVFEEVGVPYLGTPDPPLKNKRGVRLKKSRGSGAPRLKKWLTKRVIPRVSH